MRDRSTAAVALLGVAYLAVGDAGRAVPLLEEAVAVPFPSARARSDLSAAYLVRALGASDAQDLPKALGSAALAAKEDPLLAEARFNRALALERLHLAAESQEAWRDYLNVDAGSAWASEARSHLLVLEAPQMRTPEDERQVIEAAASGGDAEAVRRAVRSAVQPAREWVEEQLLVSWADAASGGDMAAASAIAARARRIADAVGAITGDPYLLEAVDAVRRVASPQEAKNLARAHAAFRRAMVQYENNEFVESGRTFSAIRAPLKRARSPFAMAASLQVAISAYFASNVELSARELDGFMPSAASRRYVRLLGLASRMRALVEFVGARFEQSFAFNQRALGFFETAADGENVSAIESSLAENLEFLGEPRAAWIHRARALAGLRHVRSLRRRHTILVSSVLSCLRQGSPEAAAYFQSAVLANARAWNRPEALAEANVRQAELHGQTGEFARVSTDLAEARRWMALVPSSSVARQIETRILLASASFTVRAASPLDEAALTDALAYLRKSGLNWALAKAYLARGRAYVARGRPDLAERDFLDGIEEFERQRATVNDDALRVSYFDQPWDLFSEMVRLQTTTRGRPDLALTFAERGRARTLLESVVGTAQAVPLDLQALQAGLPADVVIVYYAVLDYDVVVWRLTSASLESFEASIAHADLERLVTRFRAEIAEGASRFRDTAAQLYDRLVRPAVRDLSPGTTVVFVPDGVLHALPFAALIDRGTGRYLIQDLSMAVAPSASVFLAASAARATRPPSSARVALVMGNPRTESTSDTLPDLPEAGREVEQIASLYASASVVTGGAATRQRFLDDFDRNDVVHFAGHAISNSDFPALSRLVFASTKEGASESLFAHELAGRHFRRAQILVLAACQTSGGRIRRGEGVLSLARPFLSAGVPTVVASLWDADDRATRPLLVAFHAALHDGAPPAQALRSAQLSMLAGADGASNAPARWAGFVVVGAVGAGGSGPLPGGADRSRRN